jgi:hypothetical protein
LSCEKEDRERASLVLGKDKYGSRDLESTSDYLFSLQELSA